MRIKLNNQPERLELTLTDNTDFFHSFIYVPEDRPYRVPDGSIMRLWFPDLKINWEATYFYNPGVFWFLIQNEMSNREIIPDGTKVQLLVSVADENSVDFAIAEGRVRRTTEYI